MTSEFGPDSFDPDRFNSDPHYRWKYLVNFLNFDQSDWQRIQATEPVIRPRIQTIVEELYDVLLDFEPTAALYRDEDGDFDDTLLEDRIEGFELWFERIFDSENRREYVTYLAKVGSIHTDKLGFEEMVVDEEQLGPTFSWLTDRIASILGDHFSDPHQALDSLSSWQKFFSLQLSVFRMAYRSPDDS